MVLYRCDETYGNAGHSSAEILAYETLCLNNLWIMDDLIKKVQENSSREEIDILIKAQKNFENLDLDEDDDYTPYLQVFQLLINLLERTYNYKINYLLWLTDIESLLDIYFKNEYSEDSIDAYETGLELIHFECDGNLYAYDKKPEKLPIDEKWQHLNKDLEKAKRNKLVKAININWDTDGEEINLPTEIEIPNGIAKDYEENLNNDAISDYISDVTGFCHYGFELDYTFDIVKD